MLAASAMNGALLDSTFNFFFKLKYNKLFDQMLATPLTTTDVARGELTWSLLRGGIYSAGFLLVMVAMGLVGSWWAVLAAARRAADRLRLRRRVHGADDVHALLAGLRLRHARRRCRCSCSRRRSSRSRPSPTWLQWVVELTPLYRGVVLVRELTTGVLTWGSAVSVVYLLAMGLSGCRGRAAARPAPAHLRPGVSRPRG